MNGKDARLFVRLSESGSFKSAATQLSISRATVSKRLAALEKEFGTILIHRNSRNIKLTQAGLILAEQCLRICDAEDSAIQLIHGHGTQPVGTLQLAIPTSLGSSLLPMLMRDFSVNYPKVSLSVHLSDKHPDVIRDGFDLAITLTRKLEDSSLTAQRLATSEQVLVASPDYLKKYGTPTDAAQLSTHRCLDIGYASNSKKSWQFWDGNDYVDVDVRCSMTYNCYIAAHLAARLDMGFMYVPEMIVRNDVHMGRLKVVLPESTRPFKWGLFAVYPHRKLAPKTKALLDFIKARIPLVGQFDGLSPFAAADYQSHSFSKIERVV